ncbi:Protein DOG1-like 4 [Bienertia sinuspersici]
MVITTAQFSTKSTHSHLNEHVSLVRSHYENYYQDKLVAIKENVLLVLSPDWLLILGMLPLDGGWWPTIAFHLFYSKVGLQFEESLTELLKEWGGCRKFGRFLYPATRPSGQAERKTIREERRLKESLTSHQEIIADRPWSSFQ